MKHVSKPILQYSEREIMFFHKLDMYCAALFIYYIFDKTNKASERVSFRMGPFISIMLHCCIISVSNFLCIDITC